MNLEALVRLVVSEVLQSLREEKRNRSALVIFTGGKTGCQPAVDQIKILAAKGWELVFACSKDGEAIYGQELRQLFPQGQFLSSPLSVSPVEIQRNLDLVLIPVLSQNSLAKVALGIADTLPTLLIKMALLLGKPMVAARNGGDARYFAKNRGLTTPSPGYLAMLDGYLEKVQGFGLKLVELAHLSEMAETMVGEKEEPSYPVEPGNSGFLRAQGIISREEILAASFQGQDILYPTGTLVTPLARDLALKYGVKLLEEK